MIGTLLKIRLSSVMSSLASVKKKGRAVKVSPGKIALFSVIYLYVIVVFGGMFTGLSFLTAPLLIGTSIEWLYFALFNAITFTVVFVLSIFETKSQLFECKDNELLLSMPIKPRAIVLSRIFTVLLFNYIETALVMIPCIVAYAVFGGSIYGITGSVISFILLPLLATSLASGVGYAVALIAKKMKNNSIATTVIALAFLGLYFWAYYSVMGSGEIDIVQIGQSLTALRFIGEISLCHPLYTSLFVAIAVGVTLFAYCIISRSYISIVTAKGGAKRKEYRRTDLKKGSAYTSIVKKEFSYFFSNATYMLNGAVGAVFTVAIGVMLLINGSTVLEFFGAFGTLGASPERSAREAACVLGAALIVLNSFSTMSASPLSLEGNGFWIIKTVPVSMRTVLFAKATPSFIVSALPNVFAAVCILIVVKADLVSCVLLILTALILSYLSSVLGLVLNCLFPKFSFENVAQVVKQSLPTFLIMLIMTLIGIVCFVLSAVFSFVLGLPLVGMGCILALLILLSGIFTFVLAGPMSRKIDKLSV